MLRNRTVVAPGRPAVGPVTGRRRRRPMFRARLGRHGPQARLWRATPVIPLVALLSLFPSRPVDRAPPPIHVLVDGSMRVVSPGTTVAEARVVLGLRPRTGDLVDVEGVPLHRDRFRGRLRLNGGPARPRMVLSDQDVIEVVDARDRIEPVRVEVVPVPGGQMADPQTHLGTTPGDQVITSGSISGKLVSTVFRPTGEADVPRSVALTFDDGPSPTWTPQILRILQRFEVKATFFMIGDLVERYPGVVRRVRKAGMAIGNHSLGHPFAPAFTTLPRGDMKAQIVGGHRRLADVGVESALFRPPGGSWDDDVLSTASEVGERTVLWSIDALDWRTGKPGSIVQRVLGQAGPGSIILLHDGGGDRSATVAALPRIIRGLQKMGLSLESL